MCTSSQLQSIKFLGDVEEAREDLYFSKEDEKLIKKLLEAHPELAYADSQSTDSADSVANQVKYVFMQHGIPPNANDTLIKDIVKLVEKYTKKNGTSDEK